MCGNPRAEYQIDLNARHARELWDALARYMDAARQASATARKPARGGRRAAAGAGTLPGSAQRARAQGIEVKDRGRYPLTWWPNSRPPPPSQAEVHVPRGLCHFTNMPN